MIPTKGNIMNSTNSTLATMSGFELNEVEGSGIVAWVGSEDSFHVPSAQVAREGAEALIEAASALEKSEMEAEGHMVFDLDRGITRDPRHGEFYLVETSKPGLGVVTRSVHPISERMTVGEEWDSNFNETTKRRKQPAEFSYRVVAKVRLLAEWSDLSGEKTLRYITV